MRARKVQAEGSPFLIPFFVPDGLDIVNDAMTADKLTKELVDAFVEKVIMKPERQVEIVWKFKQ